VGVEPPLTPDASPDFQNLYLQDNTSGALQTLTPASPAGAIEPKNYCVGFGGMTPDGSHALVYATGALTPEASPAAGINLYEWSRDEGLKLVNVLPGAIVGQPTPLSGFGAQRSNEGFCGNGLSMERNAISSDGSKVLWTYVPPQSKEEEKEGTQKPTRLLALLEDGEPIQIDARQKGPGKLSGGGLYWAADPSGTKVLFTDPNGLVPGSKEGENDLYLYDFADPIGERLKDLTSPGVEPAAVEGVVAESEDLSSVYFVARGALTSVPNSDGGTAEAGADNLYLWHEGDALRFVAPLSDIDSSDWSASPESQTARSSADGKVLTFMSTAPLTGYDNHIAGSQTACPLDVEEERSTASPDCEEVFLFDAETGDLACVSCNPTNSRPSGPSMLPGWTTGFEQPRYLNADGSRLFFESIDSILPQDLNGRRDVYEWERAGSGSCSGQSPTFNARSGGCMFLISTGTSGVSSYLIDASADGDDVFISTRQRLVTQDEDDHYDVYDARVGGGFPPSPVAAPACETETECREMAQMAPGGQAPPTATSPSEGNVKERSRHHHARCRRRRHPTKSGAKRLCAPKKNGRNHPNNSRKHQAKNSGRHHR
jgi:hypothetical protein